MIQRIQSVYLLLASIAIGVTFLFPLASFIGSGEDQLVYYIYKVISEVPGNQPALPSYFIYPNLVLAILAFLLSFIAIFQFKKMAAQMKMIRGGIFFVMVMIGIFFFYSIPYLEEASGNFVEYDKFGAAMPLLALVFLFLANRAILSDVKLLKSADRLR